MNSLVLAYPSKGRVRPLTDACFADAGIPVLDTGTDRRYAYSLSELPQTRLLLAEAAAIPGLLARGEAHAGITGIDLVEELLPDAEAILEAPLPLGFGHARIAVAVPECWIDVNDIADFDDAAFAFRRAHGRRLRIATGYRRLARQFLAEQCGADYELVRSRGPTEAAPLAGLAEAIVDVVDSGRTLRANRLKILQDGVILESQTCLWVSREASWTGQVSREIKRLCERLSGGRD